MRKAVVFLASAVSLASFVVSGVLVAQRLAFLGRATHASAVVVANVGSNSICPVFRFTPAEAASIDVKSDVCAKSPAWKLGESVDVLYDAADPRGSARIESATQLWGAPAVFGIWAIAWALFAVQAARRKRKPGSGLGEERGSR